MDHPQNIYDDPGFFAGYRRLRQDGAGLNDVLEQPALWELLPQSLQGLRVLDLGCGFGDFARKARKAGAAEVLGIDVSRRMLAEAAQSTHDPDVHYRRQAIECLEWDGAPFDLAVSSLALHYVEDYPAALARIGAALAPGGLLVFSVEHPLCTALPQQRWVRDTDGRALHWPVDRYQEEGPRRTTWFVEGVIKYHRTVETYVTGLLAAGFSLTALKEPVPVDCPAASAIPDIALHRRRPPFLLFAARRLPDAPTST